ncbi:MAG: DUF460 domain-containing protein [archaeon]
MALLIVGIDPGTTAAYALLDEHGTFISSASGKEFSMGEMISSIIGFGRPLIVASDKNPFPSFVQEIATKLGAKLSYPKEDLLVEEKRQLVDELLSGDRLGINVHEQDALAAAILAHRKHKNFLEKIDHYIDKKGKPEIREEFKLLMVRNDQLPFDSALELIEKRHEKQPPALPAPERPRAQEKVYNQRLIHELEARVAMLEERNARLKRYLKEKDKLIIRLQRRISGMNDDSKDAVVEHKEQRIRQFSRELKGNARLLRHQEKELSRRDEFIAKLNKGVLVKKLANLGQQEFSDKRFLDIKAEDILLVDDINQRSQAVIDALKGKVRVIVTAELPKKQEQEFIFLKREGLIIDESENYAIADRNALDEALKKKELLKSVVDEYRKERLRLNR